MEKNGREWTRGRIDALLPEVRSIIWPGWTLRMGNERLYGMWAGSEGWIHLWVWQRKGHWCDGLYHFPNQRRVVDCHHPPRNTTYERKKNEEKRKILCGSKQFRCFDIRRSLAIPTHGYGMRPSILHVLHVKTKLTSRWNLCLMPFMWRAKWLKGIFRCRTGRIQFGFEVYG